MLACACIALAFVPSPLPAPLLAPAPGRSASASIAMSTENVKAGGITAFAGTIASAPVKATALMTSKAMTASLAFNTWSLAVELALFGIIYRYAVRSDGDDLTKGGMLLMFTLFRALASTHMAEKTSGWTPDMWLQFAAYFGESALAFGAAATALEYAWERGWTQRLWYLEDNSRNYGRGRRDRYDDYYGRDVYGRDTRRGSGTFGTGTYGRVSPTRALYDGRDMRRRR